MSKAYFKEVYKQFLCEKCGVRPLYTSRANPTRAERLCRTCYVAESVERKTKYKVSDLSYADRRAHVEKRKEYAKEWYENHKDAHKIIALLSYYKNFSKNREKKNAWRRAYYKKTGW